MDSTILQNAILNAIDVITENKINKIQADKTVTVQIKKCSNALTGEYRVIYNGGTVIAYATSGMTYTTGQAVYMLIPQGDMTKRKTLLGVAQTSGGNSNISFVSSAMNDYNLLGKNCFAYTGDDRDVIGVHSYLKEEALVLYQRDADKNLFDLDVQELENNLKESEAILVQAQFFTKLTPEHKVNQSANYGVTFRLAFDDRDHVGEDGKPITKLYSYTLDTYNMTGNPFRFTSWNTQYQMFPIDLKNFKYIDSVIFWERDFEPEDNAQMAAVRGKDILIKDIRFYGLKHITAVNGEYSMKLSFPDGSTFRSQGSTPHLEIIATLKKANLNLSDSATYYWFRKDARVSESSSLNKFYNAWGGSGWYYLGETKGNNYRIYSLFDENKAYENLYKVVCVYNNTMKLVEEFTLYNEACKRDLAITSDMGVKFCFDRGSHIDENGETISGPKLTCTINGYSSDFERDNETSPHADSLFTFVWSKVDSTSGTTLFNETKENLQEQYDNLRKSTDTNMSQDQINAKASNLFALKSRIDALTDVSWHNNVLIYPVRGIDSSATFNCSVYLKDTEDGNPYSIGTASILLQNEAVPQPTDYYITIENGNQIFQYNEYGKSPARSELQDPQKIFPLKCHFFDPNGIEVNPHTYTVKWKVPLSSTMITLPSSGMVANPINNVLEYNVSTEYPLGIEDEYDYYALYNQIQCIVNYSDQEYTQYTSLTFTKVGENGTNGTDVVAKIYPADKKRVNDHMPAIMLKGGKSPQWDNGDTMSTKEFAFGLYQKNAEVQLTDDYKINWHMAGGGYGTKSRNSKYLAVDDGIVTYQTDNANGAWFRNQIITANVRYPKGEETGTDYNAYYPIAIIDEALSKSDNYSVKIDYDNTLKSVLYNADGHNPLYNRNQGVKVILERIVTNVDGTPKENENGKTITEEVSDKYIVWSAAGGQPESINDDLPQNPDFRLIRYKTSDVTELEDSGLTLLPKHKTETHKIYYKDGDDIPVNKKVGDVVKIKNALGEEVDKTETIELPEYEDFTEVYILPNDEYSGEFCNNMVVCRIFDSEEDYQSYLSVGKLPEVTIYYPILMTLNTYGLKSLNSWNGTHLEINQDEDYILAPQIGAGEKDSQNRFTGIVMGKGTFYDKLTDTYKDSSKKTVSSDGSMNDVKLTGNLEPNTALGLLGYSHGKQSIFLDAETGSATFGLPEGNNEQGDDYSNATTLDDGSDDLRKYGEGRIKLVPGGTSSIGNWKIGSRLLYNIMRTDNTTDDQKELNNPKLIQPYPDLRDVKNFDNQSNHYKVSIPSDTEGVMLSSDPAYISIKGRMLDNVWNPEKEADFQSAQTIVQPYDSFEIQLDPNQSSLFTVFRHTASVELNKTRDEVSIPASFSVERIDGQYYICPKNTQAMINAGQSNVADTSIRFSRGVTDSNGNLRSWVVEQPATDSQGGVLKTKDSIPQELYIIARPIVTDNNNYDWTAGSDKENYFFEFVRAKSEYVIPEYYGANPTSKDTIAMKKAAERVIFKNLYWHREPTVGINEEGRFYTNALKDSTTSFSLGAVGAFGVGSRNSSHAANLQGYQGFKLSTGDGPRSAVLAKFFTETRSINDKHSTLYFTGGTDSRDEYARELRMNFKEINSYVTDELSSARETDHKFELRKDSINLGHYGSEAKSYLEIPRVSYPTHLYSDNGVRIDTKIGDDKNLKSITMNTNHFSLTTQNSTGKVTLDAENNIDFHSSTGSSWFGTENGNARIWNQNDQINLTNENNGRIYLYAGNDWNNNAYLNLQNNNVSTFRSNGLNIHANANHLNINGTRHDGKGGNIPLPITIYSGEGDNTQARIYVLGASKGGVNDSIQLVTHCGTFTNISHILGNNSVSGYYSNEGLSTKRGVYVGGTISDSDRDNAWERYTAIYANGDIRTPTSSSGIYTTFIELGSDGANSYRWDSNQYLGQYHGTDIQGYNIWTILQQIASLAASAYNRADDAWGKANDAQSRVSTLEDWRKTTVDPTLTDHNNRITSLEGRMATAETNISNNATAAKNAKDAADAAQSAADAAKAAADSAYSHLPLHNHTYGTYMIGTNSAGDPAHAHTLRVSQGTTGSAGTE